MTDETKKEPAVLCCLDPRFQRASNALLLAVHDIATVKMSRPEMYRKAKDALDKVDQIYKDDKLTK